MSIFNSVKLRQPKRSTFDLSHENKLTCDFGQLVPIYTEEVLPGDKFKVSTESFVRFAPMIAPIMHQIDVYVHYFFVPNRIIWSHWQDFITGGRDGKAAPAMPIVNLSTASMKNFPLFDYFGYQFGGTPTEQYSRNYNSLPLRAYLKIFDDFYRDQNLSESLFSDTLFNNDGLDNSFWDLLSALRYRCLQKDYFTSALPWTQRGSQAVLPRLGQVPIVFDNDAGTTYVRSATGQTPSGNLRAFSSSTPVPGKALVGDATTTENDNIDNSENLRADLSEADPISINTIRRTVQLQAWLERNALGGGRYIEQILSHFGIRVPDYRLQRPEYLGGGKSPVVVSEVLQTGSSSTTSPQGNMAGHGISVGNSNAFTRSFDEHGYVIGIMSILPKNGYFQGVPRNLLKFDKLDYAFPEFSQLGEQEVYTEELYNSSDIHRGQIFGYQSRYAEYKHHRNEIHGDFRDTLEFWHLATKYQTQPYLNAEFVSSNRPIDFNRIFAVTDKDYNHLWVELYNHIKIKRLLPYYGTPNLGYPLN